MKSKGFTLLEIMISVSVMAVISSVLFLLATSLAQGARMQEAKITTVDEARMAMMIMVRELRQSATTSVSWATLPGPTLSYRTATDLDGNGSAIDVNGSLELGAVRTLTRDANDINGDGLTMVQLVIVEGATVRVLANNLLLNEDVNDSGVLDPGEDNNANGVLDRGLWFERLGRGIQITIQAQRASDVEETVLLSSLLTETVVPRN